MITTQTVASFHVTCALQAQDAQMLRLTPFEAVDNALTRLTLQCILSRKSDAQGAMTTESL